MSYCACENIPKSKKNLKQQSTSEPKIFRKKKDTQSVMYFVIFFYFYEIKI